MNELRETLALLAAFAMIALASREIGRLALRTSLPLISGFLLAGIIAGPYVLGLIPHEVAQRLRFLDQVSLAFIAFAAGSELYVRELRGRFRSISRITFGNALIVPVLGAVTLYLVSDQIPFLHDSSTEVRLAAALLTGAILVARSPSSVIAIVNELRAKGPFTQMIIGVTMFTDVVVIVLFALASEIADALLMDLGFSVTFVGLLLSELLLSVLFGVLVGVAIIGILRLKAKRWVKMALILVTGESIFVISGLIRTFTHEQLPFEIFMEPLLVAMIGSFVVTNRSGYRTEFRSLLHDLGPAIYVIFFTLTGASLALDVLAATWPVALLLFAVRLIGIAVGSFLGGAAAGDPAPLNRHSWMGFVTMAGVGLGLAAEAAVEFPELGTPFATTVISVIILSQLVGPPLIKWAIQRLGEAHPKAEAGEFDGRRDALIFGVESQSVALARQLSGHGWQVRLACRDTDYTSSLEDDDEQITVLPFEDLRLADLQQLGAHQADAIITMLSDEENYRICTHAYEQFGTDTLVVRLNERANLGRFRDLEALIVDPATAIVSLMDHFVRSPSGASLLMGMSEEQDVVDLQITSPDLDGVPLRDLRLPLDIIILSVQRDGQTIITHGYTRLRVGDRVTVVGSTASIDRLSLRFEAAKDGGG